MQHLQLHIEADAERQTSPEFVPSLALVTRANAPAIAHSGSCFGNESHRRAIDGIILIQTHHNVTTQVPDHRHGSPVFFLVLRGVVEMLSNSRRVRLGSGQAAFLSSADIHSFRVLSQSAHSLCVEIGGTTADVFRGLLGSVLGKTSRIPLLLAQLNHEVSCQDVHTSLAVQGLVLQMAAVLTREQRPVPVTQPQWLINIERFFETNLGGPIDMEYLVTISGVSPKEIRKAFRRYLKRTPAEYLRCKRIETARVQLIATRQTIADIAAAAGFYDQAHFCHQFRKATGYSPREFRECMGAIAATGRTIDASDIG